MSGYSKLFSSIIHSTVWREPDHIRLVWITMLAMKDRDGMVEASIPGLADAARVGIPQCEEALLRLSSPDPYSRTPNYEGRRISDVPGGWEILNHEIYQEKDSPEDRNRKNAEKQKRYRERLRERKADNASCDGGNAGNALRNAGNALPDVTGCYQALHTTDTDTDTDTEGRKNIYNTSKDQVEETSKVDLQPIDEALEFLPIEQDRLLAKFILTAWPDCTVQDAIAWIQQAKNYLLQLEGDPLEWIQDVATSRSPNDPVYVQGRNKLHQWLMNCLKNTIRKQAEQSKPKLSPVKYGMDT
jgi:hypothetical protein